ncbi:MAG: hypothetical protein M3Z37_10205 [Candidatus Eremiobacteraeota bacterium]|nr:hypothetical protein [Candidatus Eremiobacteraeota bacterium]
MADRKKSNLTQHSNEDLDREYPANERERESTGGVRVSGTDRRRDDGDASNPTSHTGVDHDLDDNEELEEE